MICAVEYVSSGENTQFQMFGLIGYFNGQLTIQLLSSQCQILPGSFSYSGIIGYSNGTQSIFTNVQIQYQMVINNGNISGSLAGVLNAALQSIYNISIESQIEAHLLVGLIAARSQNCNITKAKIVSSQVSGNTYDNNQFSAGLIAQTVGYLQIIQCYINQISVSSQSNYTWAISGGLLGDIVQTLTKIQQTQLISSQISSSGSVADSVNSAGLVGYQFDGQMDVIDVQIQYTNITAISTNIPRVGTFCGTFAGYLVRQKIYLTNSKIITVQIYANGQSIYTGIIIAVNKTTLFTANGVSTEGINIINNQIIANCANVISQSQTGC
ncbi:Hypothetical_protein [Hexamita inflata]|nr:Hypothetical protein HINF_LOCUS33085 [Hexamita inflata]